MKMINPIKSILKLTAAISAIAASMILSNCGGGGGGSDSDNITRPKSLNGLELSLDDGRFRIEFVRHEGSGIAANNGDQESGSVILIHGGNEEGQLVYPSEVGQFTYTYRGATNNTGILTITSTNTNADEIYTGDGAPPYALYFSTSDTPIDLKYTLEFNHNGSTLTDISVTAHNHFDGLIYQQDFDGNSIDYYDGRGRGVETGYPRTDASEAINPNFEKVSVESLVDLEIYFTNNDGVPQFSTSHRINDDNGNVTVYDSNGVVQIGAGTYSYRRLGESVDKAELICSQNTGKGGIYTLTFTSYGVIGAQDSTGTFIVSNPGEANHESFGKFYIKHHTTRGKILT